MYKAFVRAKSGCDKWHDTRCQLLLMKPTSLFIMNLRRARQRVAIKHVLTDIMPALCSMDFASMELLHARLVRTTTCVDGCRCDYTICGDKIHI